MFIRYFEWVFKNISHHLHAVFCFDWVGSNFLCTSSLKCLVHPYFSTYIYRIVLEYDVLCMLRSL